MENLLPWTKPSVVPAPPHIIWREMAAVDVTGYAVEADGTPWLSPANNLRALANLLRNKIITKPRRRRVRVGGQL